MISVLYPILIYYNNGDCGVANVNLELFFNGFGILIISFPLKKINPLPLMENDFESIFTKFSICSLLQKNVKSDSEYIVYDNFYDLPFMYLIYLSNSFNNAVDDLRNVNTFYHIIIGNH